VQDLIIERNLELAQFILLLGILILSRMKGLNTFSFPYSMRQGIIWPAFTWHGQQLFSFLLFVQGIGYTQRGQLHY